MNNFVAMIIGMIIVIIGSQFMKDTLDECTVSETVRKLEFVIGVVLVIGGIVFALIGGPLTTVFQINKTQISAAETKTPTSFDFKDWIDSISIPIFSFSQTKGDDEAITTTDIEETATDEVITITDAEETATDEVITTTDAEKTAITDEKNVLTKKEKKRLKKQVQEILAYLEEEE